MQSDKAAMEWLGTRAVDRVVQLATGVGASLVVTAGYKDYGLPNALESGVRRGPVGGIVRGLQWLSRGGFSKALVLAVDAPTIRPDDIQMLLDAGTPGAFFKTLNLPFVLDIQTLPRAIGASASIRDIFSATRLPELSYLPGAYSRLRGANTPFERETLLEELRHYEGQRPNKSHADRVAASAQNVGGFE